MDLPNAAGERFLRGHKLLSDDVILGIPPMGVITPWTLFVCTHAAQFGNLHYDFVSLTELLCDNPHGCMVAINSNFGHAAQPGWESLLKIPKPPEARVRKVQGDGTCFNSAIEPIIKIKHPGVHLDKIYKVKCFPTTGATQIPGVICPDLSDAKVVLDALVNYLNEFEIGDLVVDVEEHIDENCELIPAVMKRLPVTLESHSPNMLNYKFRINRNSPRILVNLREFANLMFQLETTKAVRGKPREVGWPQFALPPFPVREVNPPNDDVKVSFRFENIGRSPRINVFQTGKINILGANSVAFAHVTYNYFAELFAENWLLLICLQPRRDNERKIAAVEPKPEPEPEPEPEPVTDVDVRAVLNLPVAPAEEESSDGYESDEIINVF